MLASASDAIIIGFNVRPAGNDSLLIKKKLIFVTILLFMQLSMT
jgi:hypothetical protein